jgi:hypothetical protein
MRLQAARLLELGEIVCDNIAPSPGRSALACIPINVCIEHQRFIYVDQVCMVRIHDIILEEIRAVASQCNASCRQDGSTTSIRERVVVDGNTIQTAAVCRIKDHRPMAVGLIRTDIIAERAVLADQTSQPEECHAVTLQVVRVIVLNRRIARPPIHVKGAAVHPVGMRVVDLIELNSDGIRVPTPDRVGCVADAGGR